MARANHREAANMHGGERPHDRVLKKAHDRYLRSSLGQDWIIKMRVQMREIDREYHTDADKFSVD